MNKETGWGHIAMLNKISDFFQICDSEGKGFITHHRYEGTVGVLKLDIFHHFIMFFFYICNGIGITIMLSLL